MVKKIYLDYAATTPVDPRVTGVMKPYFTDKYGNPSSPHSWGTEAAEAMEWSRNKVAEVLGVEPGEIKFTSGATESNNTALKGAAFANERRKNPKKHIITTKIEHPCILETSKWLKKRGYDITYVGVDENGIVDPEEVKNSIREDTILVSVMHANNEIGTIQPIDEIGKICRENGVYFHTDAAQTFGKIDIPIDNVDLLSLSSHKIYGPKGVGALFVRKGVRMDPLLHGGGHESGLRSGTENVPGIVGLGKAAELVYQGKDEPKRLAKLRDKIIAELEENGAHLNGHRNKRLYNNANVYFDYIEGESLVLLLDEKGIAVSTGSACSSKKLEPSHVLTALGLRPEQAHGSLRVTLGRWTKEEDVDYFLEVIPDIVKKLRDLSPFT